MSNNTDPSFFQPAYASVSDAPEDILERLRLQERMERAAAEQSANDADRRVHAELAQLIYARRKRLEACSDKR